MSTLKLADNLIIPIGRRMAEVGGQRIGIIGKSGSGKTNTQLVLTRAWMENGWPIAIIDPMNAYRALRQAGLPILIAGPRKSADLHLTIDNAAKLAEMSFKERFSIILDMSLYRGKDDTLILKNFLDKLLDLLMRQDEDAPILPYALNIDEAHLYVPQVGVNETTYVINDLAKVGRQLGLSIFFSTQTPTDIQKRFLKQRNLIIAHNVNGSDINILAEAVLETASEVRPVVDSLKTGQAIIKGDSELLDTHGAKYLLTQIHKWELTSNALTVSMDETSRVRPIDPMLIAQLQETMKRPAHRVDDRDALITELQRHISQLKAEIERLRNVQPVAALEVMGRVSEPEYVPVMSSPNPTRESLPRKPLTVPSVERTEVQEPLLINTGSRRILQKLAEIHPLLVTRAQLGTLADYKITGGTFLANFGALKKLNFVVESDLIAVTQGGFDYLGIEPREIPNTKDEVLRMWQDVLKPQEWQLMWHLIGQHPSSIEKDILAVKVGMTSTGGAFNSYLGNLRRNALVIVDTKAGSVRANGEMLLL